MLINYVLCDPLSFNVLFAVVDTLDMRRFTRLIDGDNRMDVGGAVATLKKTCLFLTLVDFYARRSMKTQMFLPCLKLLLCVVVARLCLGGGGPANG